MLLHVVFNLLASILAASDDEGCLGVRVDVVEELEAMLDTGVNFLSIVKNVIHRCIWFKEQILMGTCVSKEGQEIGFVFSHIRDTHREWLVLVPKKCGKRP